VHPSLAPPVLRIGVEARIIAKVAQRLVFSDCALPSSLLGHFRRPYLPNTSFIPKIIRCRWGSPEFIGLGFLSFSTIILTEIFGSPFLKNISIIVGLVVGCIVAGAAGYIDSSTIKAAPAITFLWVHRFKINVYPPAILPMLTVYGSFLSSVYTIISFK